MNTVLSLTDLDPLANLLGDWSKTLNTGSAIFRVAMVVILAAVIGCERSSKRHSAGLRTFILISFASAAAMLLDLFLMEAHGCQLPLLSAATLLASGACKRKFHFIQLPQSDKGIDYFGGTVGMQCFGIYVRCRIIYIDSYSLFVSFVYSCLLSFF